MFDAIVKRSWSCHKVWTDTPEPVFKIFCYLKIFTPVSKYGEKVLFEAGAWHIGCSVYEGFEMSDVLRILSKQVASRVKRQLPDAKDIYYKNTRSGEMYKEQKLPLRYRSTEIHANNC